VRSLLTDQLCRFINESHFFQLTYLSTGALLLAMADTIHPETVSFTVKGQVVIPRRIRREFEIENGTKAVVQTTPEGILLKPITGAAIKRARGVLKRKRGEKPLRRWWSEYKKEEKKLEEARYARLRPR
jgi:AbrB family looped-hinge helix DNA binding protein